MRTRDQEEELELESELEAELEFEGELEYEGELEFEGEAEFEGELEAESEWELEAESEYEYEGEEEWELEGEEEQLFGTIARGIGGLISGGSGEFEEEFELEGEEFLRGAGRWLRRAAPVLRRIARVAAPIVGTAVGGPAGGLIGRGLAQALREEEGEFEEEFELESGTASRTRAVAEMMAAAASQAQSEAEAEAYIGAASVQTLTVRDRRAIQELLPHLVHGSAVLTRILRRSPISSPAVRAVPTIVQGTAQALRRRVDAGMPVNPSVAGAVMAQQTRRVLSSPSATSTAISRNMRATRRVARPAAGMAGTRRVVPGRRRRPLPGGPARRAPRAGRPVVVAQMPSGRMVPARVIPVRGARAVPRPVAPIRRVR